MDNGEASVGTECHSLLSKFRDIRGFGTGGQGYEEFSVVLSFFAGLTEVQEALQLNPGLAGTQKHSL